MSNLDFTTAHHSCERDLPENVSRSMFLSLVGLIAVLLVAMEIKAQSDNYPVNLPFTQDMWIGQWLRLDDLPDDHTVIIGASRMQFGFIVDTWEQQTGDRPLLLAWPGQPTAPILNELAERESFTGTVLCGIAPSFSFIAEGPPWGKWISNNIKRAETTEWSLSFHLSLATQYFIRPWIKCINDAAYSPIANMFARFPFPNRKGILEPVIWRFDASRDENMQMRFLDIVEQNVDRQKLILKLQASIYDRLTHFGPANMDTLLSQFQSSVKKIKSRGGKVIFIRPPSNGSFRQFERDHYPRNKYFDRLVSETGCLGIHFEDYPELRNFRGVEESHLSKADGIKFTQRVIGILQRKGTISQSGFNSPLVHPSNE